MLPLETKQNKTEWREFFSKSYLAGRKKLDDSSRLHVVEIARIA